MKNAQNKKVIKKSSKKKVVNIFFSLVKPFVLSFIKVKKIFLSKPLLKKIFFTLILISLFRVAATITIPGVKIIDNGLVDDSSSFLGIMDLMGGGAIRNYSLVALGISPYITSSIIMTMLQSEFFPPINRLANSGSAGKRKINIITRFLTIIFGIFQAITISKMLNSRLLEIIPQFNHWWFIYLIVPSILLAGTMFSLFIGEQITKKGVGNGTSLIIFSGVASNLPYKMINAYKIYVEGNGAIAFSGIMNFIGYVLMIISLIAIVGYIYSAERHIPLQQTGKGMTKDVKEMTRLPIKLNVAGVMPVMFSSLVISIPLQIASMLDETSDARSWIMTNMRFTDLYGMIIYASTTFLFSMAMAVVIFQPNRVAENFQKSSTFIPGIKPGQETEDYLFKVIMRLSLFSAVYLTLISIIPFVCQVLGMDRSITLGGTSLIILVTVSIETMNQIHARKKSGTFTKSKKNLINNPKGGELLW